MDPDWLTGIGTLVLATATFVLAGITFWALRKSSEANRLLREENERMRAEDKEENRRLIEEEREHRLKKYALDMIYDWVVQVEEYIFFLEYPKTLDEIAAIVDKILVIRVQAIRVRQHTAIFGDRLNPLFSAVVANLRECSLFLQSIHEEISKLPLAKHKDALSQKIVPSNWSLTEKESSRCKLYDSACELSDSIIKLRLELNL